MDAARNIMVFRETLERIKEDPRLREAAGESRKNTVFYPADAAIPVPQARYADTEVVVSGKRSGEAAAAYRGKRIAVLNFASAVNPGGGVRSGSSAQEESLCRISTLYPALSGNPAAEPFYRCHRQSRSSDHSDAMLFSPGIIFFRKDEAVPMMLDESEWTHAGVITSAAPDISSENILAMPGGRKEQLRQLFLSRIRRIIAIAAANADVLIAGAFGCGVFGNSPEMVAECFRTVIEEWKGSLETVEFAVYTSRFDTRNYEAFRNAFT